MKKFSRLTIGIISRNGEPFIKDCLQSFTSANSLLSKSFESIDYILVDSDSSDNTLDLMLNFAKENAKKTIATEVYAIKGFCNAAIARNVILKNCSGDVVFFCDGDIIINDTFLIHAAGKIFDEQAAAVTGQLAEKWYDSEFKIYKSVPVRSKIAQEQFVRIVGGIILLSKKVVQSGIKYDENLNIKEDNDFSLRVSSFFNILAIPAFVGTHMTQPYCSSERFKAFFKENYHQPLGVLLRKHIYSLSNFIEIAKVDKGVTAGFIYILLFLFSSILCLRQIYAPFLLTLVIFITDFLRQLTKQHLRSFIMYRFISPIMVIQGFFSSKPNNHDYSVKKLTS